VLTLVDGGRYVVRESVAEIVDRVRAFRASVVVLAGRLDGESAAASASAGGRAVGGVWGGGLPPK
jgi:Flagellar and Swarming motility proteins